MKNEIRKLVNKSREYTPIIGGFITLFVIIALVIGFILFFIRRATDKKQ